MSELKVTSISHPSASAAGITLGSDGSVVLPSGFTGGLGTNVVSTIVTSSFSTASTSFVDVTGATLSITPTSNTSKILLIASILLTTDSAATTPTAFANVSKSGSELFLLGSAAHDTARFMFYPSATYLDSPATTSAVSYEIRVRCTTGTAYVNRNGFDAGPYGVTSLTAIEVAA